MSLRNELRERARLALAYATRLRKTMGRTMREAEGQESGTGHFHHPSGAYTREYWLAYALIYEEASQASYVAADALEETGDFQRANVARNVGFRLHEQVLRFQKFAREAPSGRDALQAVYAI